MLMQLGQLRAQVGAHSSHGAPKRCPRRFMAPFELLVAEPQSLFLAQLLWDTTQSEALTPQGVVQSYRGTCANKEMVDPVLVEVVRVAHNADEDVRHRDHDHEAKDHECNIHPARPDDRRVVLVLKEKNIGVRAEVSQKAHAVGAEEYEQHPLPGERIGHMGTSTDEEQHHQNKRRHFLEGRQDRQDANTHPQSLIDPKAVEYSHPSKATNNCEQYPGQFDIGTEAPCDLEYKQECDAQECQIHALLFGTIIRQPCKSPVAPDHRKLTCNVLQPHNNEDSSSGVQLPFPSNPKATRITLPGSGVPSDYPAHVHEGS
mmetsp:Transcript_52401/g.118423  ORF Transcript_52401/g.118423 Transcript_52401/m.118423 type:complete len:316 (-) Transcript_52401:240-1187(-)